jgi:hypothetical protein
MGQLGIGAMISYLSNDGSSVSTLQAALGKKITGLELNKSRDEDSLNITFEDGSGVRFYDDGQSCCESRYMNTDDNLAYHVGATLVGAEILDGPTTEGDYDVRESQFLVVTTSKGKFTVANYNDHNGYYGGISCRVAAL